MQVSEAPSIFTYSQWLFHMLMEYSISGQPVVIELCLEEELILNDEVLVLLLQRVSLCQDGDELAPCSGCDPEPRRETVGTDSSYPWNPENCLKSRNGKCLDGTTAMSS